MQPHEVKGKVDFAIITIREDEFEAIRERFGGDLVQLNSRPYLLSQVRTHGGSTALVAVTRASEQGNGASQVLARDVIAELNPYWLLVVGIGGGVPCTECTLGDVVLATHIHDRTVRAVYEEAPDQFALSGGPASKAVKDLCSMASSIRGWNELDAIRVTRPRVVWGEAGTIYGDPDWQKQVLNILKHHFGRPDYSRPPRTVAAPIISSDTLVKDTRTLKQWLNSTRDVRALEMEAAGVYRAVRDVGGEPHLLVIRGISDIVGLNRQDAWTTYACHSAAAFAFALVKSGLVKRPSPPLLEVSPPLPEERGPRAPQFTGHFVGRQDELWQLRRALLGAPEGSQRTASIVGLHGLGGVGKSALATWFAQEHEKEFCGGVLWSDLGTNRDDGERGVDINPVGRLRGTLHQWAGQLGLEIREDTPDDVLKGRLQTALERQLKLGRVLVILDNVDSRETLEPLLKIAAHCSILVTTRQESLAEKYGLTPIRLGGFTRTASLEYLAHKLPPESLCSPGIVELLEHVMDHPMAVRLIGELMLKAHLSPEHLLKQLQRASAGVSSAVQAEQMLKNLHGCFRLSIKNLPRRSLRPLLISLASQSPVSFPLEAAAYVSGWISEDRTRADLRELVDWGFVEISGQDRYKIHRLLRDYLRVAHGREGFGHVPQRWEVTSLAWILPRLSLPISAGQAVYDIRQEAWFLRYANLHQKEPAALRKEWDGILLGIARRSALGSEGAVRNHLHALGDYLQDADFSGLSLGQIVLDGANLERARFEGADLSGTAPRLLPTLQECREAIGREFKSYTTRFLILSFPAALLSLRFNIDAEAAGIRAFMLLLLFFPVGGAAVSGERFSHLLLCGGRALHGASYRKRILCERFVAAVISTLLSAMAMAIVAMALIFFVMGTPWGHVPSLHDDDVGGWAVSVFFSGGLLLAFGLAESWVTNIATKSALGGIGRRLVSSVLVLFVLCVVVFVLLYFEKVGWVGSVAYGAPMVGLFFVVYAFLRDPESSASLYSLHSSYLRNANLQDANLRRAGMRWCCLQRAHLHRALMEGAQLQHADFTDAQLNDANLEGANLTEANLTRADLRGARLEGAILVRAILDGARFEGAIYDSRTRWPEGFVPPAAKAA